MTQPVLYDVSDHIALLTLNRPEAMNAVNADLATAFAKGEDISVRGNPQWGFGGYAEHWINKPVIAAVNGFAMGGGTELALACDLIVASAEAKFGLPEVKRGLIAAAGGLIRIQRQIPMKRDLELALTEWGTGDAWKLNNDRTMEVFGHPDAIEGPMAFAEKREPRWAD